ncbi:nuclear pore complex protein NUP50B-like isoform X1 [Bidens hawaiensis]|uniref:nuclear pore complex protein NUP50B-like isoform X1 n=1 Tax=Bidens hawaiensis TaxID=980011 RepID=UPI00404A0F70
MGDADNTLPPSKKRAAGRELSRDNPGLDDEEDVNDQETGTFKKASEEVLANRRIVKVRRNKPSSTPSAPSSNPFASIQLVQPTNPISAPSSNPFASIQLVQPTVQESQDNDKKETVKEEDGGSQEAESKADLVQTSEVASEAKKVESDVAGLAKEEVQCEAKVTESKADEVENTKVTSEAKKLDSDVAESAKEPECEAKKTESKVDEVENNESVKEVEKAATVNSFQQLSSTQNAFTGIVGTGFSSSSFSFGPITKGDQPSFPSFSFGTNGNLSLFGAASGTKQATTEGSNVNTNTPSIKQVEVETGEENEKAVFTADSILFEFIDGGWKERGKGELKVNVSTTGNEKGRLVMRAKGNFRLILNASLFPDMKLTNMDKKGITFACLNSTSEGKDGLSTFALKFKDPAIVEEFRAVVTQHKGNVNTGVKAAVSSLKTPENSP